VNQDPRQSKVKRSLADQLRIAFPALILGTFSIAALVTILASDAEIIAPEPKAIAIWAEVIGATLGVLSCAIVMGVKPRTWQTLAIASCGSIVLAVVCWMVSWTIVSKLYKKTVFNTGNLEVRGKYIPILVAETKHYRGTHYNIWLESYSALLEVDESDYVAAFGRTERTRPIGFCVHVTVQTSGSASRVMAKHGMSLPAGSVERCPSIPKNSSV